MLDSVSSVPESLTSARVDVGAGVAEIDTSTSETDTELGVIAAQSAAEAGSRHTRAES